MALALRHSFEFDPRLALPNNLILSGSTQSGKTSLLLSLLRKADTKFTPKPAKVLFLYNCFQEVYNEVRQDLQDSGIECEFVKGSKISEADLDSVADPNGGQTIIVIDDSSIAAASSPEVAQLFTMAHHKSCSIVLLLHFIFGPWPSSRIISANTNYFLLLKSVRMRQQVQTLGTQLGMRKLVSIYEEECKKPYGYVLLDLSPTTPEALRMRSDLTNDHQRVLM